MAGRVEIESYLASVKEYWRTAQGAYLDHVGTTFQAGRIKRRPEDDSAEVSNLHLAEAAGIRPGDRVLDAGCGVCGPALDIARHIPGVRFWGVTISEEQAAKGRELAAEAGLSPRVEVAVADYHRMPFAAGLFDVAVFLESSGYSYDPPLLFSEVRRVLRPGGRVYVKDVFRKEGKLRKGERAELAEFDRVFASRTAAMSEVRDAMAAAGFTDIESGDLRDAVSTIHVVEAMFTLEAGRMRATPFGRIHYRPYRQLPIVYGEILGASPGCILSAR